MPGHDNEGVRSPPRHSGARAPASEPGIQRRAPRLLMDSGSGASRRPGM